MACQRLTNFCSGNSFWSSLPSQLSFTCPATKQALIAVSSLHETQFHPVELSGGVCHPVASYSQAINAITKSNNAPPLESILMIITLFVCREFLNGQSRTAMLHMRAGLKMIEEWQASRRHVHKPNGIIEERFVPTFHCFAAKAALYDLSPVMATLPPPSFLDDPFKYELPVIPENMPSLNAARWTSDGMFLWVMSVLTSRDTILHSAHVPVVRNMVDRWLQSFVDGRIEQGLDSAQAIKCARLLRIHQRVAFIIVNAFPYQNESVFDNYVKDFCIILEMIRPLVLQEVTQAGLPKAPHEAHFDFHSGYIAPLYFTATRFRHPSLRRSALYLLRLLNRFEGGWDSCIAARIAEHVIAREEGSLTDVRCASDVPETARIRLCSASLGAAGTNEVFLRYRHSPYFNSTSSIEQERIVWQACDWSSPIAWVCCLTLSSQRKLLSLISISLWRGCYRLLATADCSLLSLGNAYVRRRTDEILGS